MDVYFLQIVTPTIIQQASSELAHCIVATLAEARSVLFSCDCRGHRQRCKIATQHQPYSSAVEPHQPASDCIGVLNLDDRALAKEKRPLILVDQSNADKERHAVILRAGLAVEGRALALLAMVKL